MVALRTEQAYSVRRLFLSHTGGESSQTCVSEHSSELDELRQIGDGAVHVQKDQAQLCIFAGQYG